MSSSSAPWRLMPSASPRRAAQWSPGSFEGGLCVSLYLSHGDGPQRIARQSWVHGTPRYLCGFGRPAGAPSNLGRARTHFSGTVHPCCGFTPHPNCERPTPHILLRDPPSGLPPWLQTSKVGAPPPRTPQTVPTDAWQPSRPRPPIADPPQTDPADAATFLVAQMSTPRVNQNHVAVFLLWLALPDPVA